MSDAADSPIEHAMMAQLSARVLTTWEAFTRTGDTLAGLIRRRNHQGLSIGDVAHRMGVDEATVQALELPGADPVLSLVHRYAHALGTSIRTDADQ